MRRNLCLFLPLLFAHFQSIHSADNNLVAHLCKAKLPSGGRYGISTFYDGNDTIYLFGGGAQYSRFKDILSYSIKQDEINSIGELPLPSYAGGTVQDSHGNLFHVRGGFGNRTIFQVLPKSGKFAKMAKLPRPNRNFALVQPTPDTAILFGGYYDSSSVIKFDMDSMNVEELPNLPEPIQYPTGIWVKEKNSAYIFPNSNDDKTSFKNITKYDMCKNEYKILQNPFPKMGDVIRAVYNGRYAYIFGTRTDQVPNDHIVQFDPKTEDVKLIQVGFDGVDDDGNGYGSYQVSDYSPVYVEKLNRIYIFGGDRWPIGPRQMENIYYIDLDPIDPNPEIEYCTCCAK